MIVARVVLTTCKPNVFRSVLKAEPNVSNFTRGFRGKAKTFEVNVREAKSQKINVFGSAFKIGEMAVIGGGLCGLGALCFYGLGLSNEVGTIERAMLWPDTVRERVKSTFTYFGLSLGAVAGSAVAFYRSPMAYKFFSVFERRPLLSMFGMLAALIGTSQAMAAIPYEPGVNAKHAMWLTNAAVLGVALSPVGFYGGPIILKAAWITAGIVGGLSTVAMCAPSEKFLSWGAPLGMGLGGVIVASLGSAFLPVTSSFQSPLLAISIYGGLLVFSGLLLYDTQKIVKRAEMHPVYGYHKYDPINASHMVVMDVLNIFIRIAQILGMGGLNRKK